MLSTCTLVESPESSLRLHSKILLQARVFRQKEEKPGIQICIHASLTDLIPLFPLIALYFTLHLLSAPFKHVNYYVPPLREQKEWEGVREQPTGDLKPGAGLLIWTSQKHLARGGDHKQLAPCKRAEAVAWPVWRECNMQLYPKWSLMGGGLWTIRRLWIVRMNRCDLSGWWESDGDLLLVAGKGRCRPWRRNKAVSSVWRGRWK